MKQGRLLLLLSVMAGLVMLRITVPPRSTSEELTGHFVPAVKWADARVREAVAPLPSSASRAASASPHVVVGNAFAVRVIQQPPAQAPPPPPPQEVAFVGPPLPPPPPSAPPPPAMQVIGTWDDPQAPAVFVSTPQGTVLVRSGSVLMAEYRVTAITAQQVTIAHAISQQTWQIPIPRTTAAR